MAYRMEKYPEVKQQFLDLVEQAGGPQNAKWCSISRILYQDFKYKVLGSRLADIYQTFTQKREISKEQLGALLKYYIEFNFDYKRTDQYISKVSNKNWIFSSKSRMSRNLKGIKLKTLRMFASVYVKNKNGYRGKISYYNLQPLRSLLSISLYEDKQLDEELIYLKQYSIKFKRLLLIFADNQNANKHKLYELTMNEFNRKQITMLLEIIEYIQEMRNIYLNEYKQDTLLNNHPFLRKTIKECKESALYKQFINTDWQSKYELYQESYIGYQDTCQSNIIISKKDKVIVTKEKFPILKNKHEIEEVQLKHEPKVKYVRGTIRQKGDVMHQSVLTRHFDIPELLNNDLEDEDENEIAQHQKEQQQQENIRNIFLQIYEQQFKQKN